MRSWVCFSTARGVTWISPETKLAWPEGRKKSPNISRASIQKRNGQEMKSWSWVYCWCRRRNEWFADALRLSPDSSANNTTGWGNVWQLKFSVGTKLWLRRITFCFRICRHFLENIFSPPTWDTWSKSLLWSGQYTTKKTFTILLNYIWFEGKMNKHPQITIHLFISEMCYYYHITLSFPCMN